MLMQSEDLGRGSGDIGVVGVQLRLAQLGGLKKKREKEKVVSATTQVIFIQVSVSHCPRGPMTTSCVVVLMLTVGHVRVQAHHNYS